MNLNNPYAYQRFNAEECKSYKVEDLHAKASNFL